MVSKNVITKSPMMSDSSVCDQNGVEPPAVAVEVDHENVEYDPNHPGCGSSSNITLLESNVTLDKHRKAKHPLHSTRFITKPNTPAAEYYTLHSLQTDRQFFFA